MTGEDALLRLGVGFEGPDAALVRSSEDGAVGAGEHVELARERIGLGILALFLCAALAAAQDSGRRRLLAHRLLAPYKDPSRRRERRAEQAYDGK